MAAKISSSGDAEICRTEGSKSPTRGPVEQSEPLGCGPGGCQGLPVGDLGLLFPDEIGQVSLTGEPAFPDGGRLVPPAPPPTPPLLSSPVRCRYKSQYTQESLELAYNKVVNGEMSTRRAAKIYSIPRSTLNDKVRGDVPLHATAGPDPVLSKEEELEIVKWAKIVARIGYGRTWRELRLAVKKFIEEDGRPNPFKDNMPGCQWMKCFMKRHKDLSEALRQNTAGVTGSKIASWFAECQKFMLDMNVEEVFSDPKRLFNADEIAFSLCTCEKTERIIAPKRGKSVYQAIQNMTQQITILGACNAAGQFVPPLIVFPGENIGDNPLQDAPKNSSFARSKNGWINSKIFYEYVANDFIPFVKSLKVKFPIVLFVDAHSSHINMDSIDLCVKENIILYCVPSYSIHIPQPLDMAVYKSLKSAWYKSLAKYMTKNQKCKIITKLNFSSVFSAAWREGATPSNAISGFRNCGLYPFNPDALDRNKLTHSSVYHNEQTPSSIPTTSIETPTSTSTVASNPLSSKAALHALEAAMGDELKATFERRLEDDDLTNAMFETWRRLRCEAAKASTPPASPSLERHTDTPNEISSCEEEEERSEKQLAKEARKRKRESKNVQMKKRRKKKKK